MIIWLFAVGLRRLRFIWAVGIASLITGGTLAADGSERSRL